MRAQLDADSDVRNLQQVGEGLRELLLQAPLTDDLRLSITEAYAKLNLHYGHEMVDVSVRSSATDDRIIL